ncbi:MAG: SEL1-like repeat protein [Alphaproteobacteria bacterium]|nr:SEL1-like repeat protein [Alphaproteobacteria bacterium]
MSFAVSDAYAFSQSLDDIYRDMLKEEHDGKLPSYMINQENKTQLFFDVAVSDIGSTHYANSTGSVEGKSISLKAGGYATKITQDWKRIVDSVEKGMVSPFDVQEIRRRVDLGDKQALELLAWMYVYGRGVSKDKKKAWRLYNKGIFLGVENAERNAKAIYKSLKRSERSQLSMY